MAKSKEYWRRRFELLQAAQMNKGDEYVKTLEAQYRRAQKGIEKDIAVWYQRLADNNNITLLEAKRILNTRELAEFRWSVEEYIKYGEENAINKKWLKQLENASARVHISRLDALKLEIQQRVEVLYGNQVDGIDDLARDIYREGYYHTAFEVQKGFRIGYDLTPIDNRRLDIVAAKPWGDDHSVFSKRCWAHRDKMTAALHKELTQSLIRGESPDKVISFIAKKFGGPRHGAISNAARLVLTESAYFASVAQKDCFTDLGVERFQILATLDDVTSELCQGLDGKVFEMKDYEASVTAPPFHAWCRSTTIPYFDDNSGERIARGKDGKTYYVPSDIAYPEWKAKYVDGKDKTAIISVDNKLKSFTKKINTIQGLPPEYKEALSNRFQNGNETAKDLFLRFVPNGSIAGGSAKGAWYSPASKKISMNFTDDLNNGRGNGTTFFHEHGHLIEDVAVPTSHIELPEIGRQRKARTAYTKPHRIQFEQILREELTKNEQVMTKYFSEDRAGRRHLMSSLSDLVHGNTEGYRHFGYGHFDKGYWKRDYQVASEAFAHFFEAQFDNSRYDIMNQFLPESMKFFENLMEEMLSQ